MKKHLLFFIAIIFISFQLQAQSYYNNDSVPDPGFEKWINNPNPPYEPYEDLEYWGTPNEFTSLAGVITVTKDTDTTYGNFAARLETKYILTFKVPGVVTLGEIKVDIITAGAEITGGIPFTRKPLRLKGYFKYQPHNNDTCVVIVLLTKFIPAKGKRDTLGAGSFFSGDTISEWTEFTAEVQYFNEEIPDSLNIIFSSSYNYYDAVPGSVMWIDNLVFEGNEGIAPDIIPKVKVNVYPNPATDNITFDLEEDPEEGEIIIYNTEGRQVYSGEVKQQRFTIDITGLTTGNYYYQLIDGSVRVSSGSFVISEK
jgi:hypothetical protein